MKYLPKEKMPENLHNKALRAFKNIQNDNWKFVICLNKKQTCQYLGISNNTLDIWIRKGMPHIRIGKTIRFDKDSIRRWMIQLENHF